MMEMKLSSMGTRKSTQRNRKGGREGEREATGMKEAYGGGSRNVRKQID